MSKNTMTDLVVELQKLPECPLREQIIAEAKAGEFHDFKNDKYVCGKVASVGLLRSLARQYVFAGLGVWAVACAAIANDIADGVYDETPDEEDRKMIAAMLAQMKEKGGA